MLPDLTPGKGATPKDAKTHIPDHEANLATLERVFLAVESESTNLNGKPDSALRVSTEPGTYWNIRAQRGLLSGYDANTPSLTATLSPRNTSNGSSPIEAIQGHLITMFDKVGAFGIHHHRGTEDRRWDEQADIARLADIVEAYSAQAQQATEKAVRDAADLARAELHGMTGAHNGRWAIEVKPDTDHVTIWETRDRTTVRLITASSASKELPDGTPARPARITVQDLAKGTLINKGRAPIRDLKKAMRQVFPERAALHAKINGAPEDTFA